LQPNDEDGLESIIPGNIIQNEANGEALKEVEKTEDSPVGQPLDVVMG